MRLVTSEALVVLRVAHALVEHLEGTHATSHVVGVAEFRASGVPFPQEVMKCLGALLGGDALVDLAALVTNDSFGKVHLIYDSIEIEPGPATEDGNLAMVEETVNALARILLEALDRVVLVDVCDVNHEERGPPLLYGGLCGPHVHAPVHLHGINGDNRRGQPLANALGERAFA